MIDYPKEVEGASRQSRRASLKEESSDDHKSCDKEKDGSSLFCELVVISHTFGSTKPPSKGNFSPDSFSYRLQIYKNELAIRASVLWVRVLF